MVPMVENEVTVSTKLNYLLILGHIAIFFYQQYLRIPVYLENQYSTLLHRIILAKVDVLLHLEYINGFVLIKKTKIT